jgi:putative transposase
MRSAGICAQTGYAKRKYKRGGAPSLVAPNHLQRQFDVQEPNRGWVTDITYIRAHKGWFHLAMVLDLFSRQAVGWSMSSRIDHELAMNGLLMAVWRRQPKQMVMVHPAKAVNSAVTIGATFWKRKIFQQSMSRYGNYHDNAVAESFFQPLKRERVRRKTYNTREEAKQDVFDYIEMFYNPKRLHSFGNDMSPVEYEKQNFMCRYEKSIARRGRISKR